jgi:CoA:oxalate CoA-transferase
MGGALDGIRVIECGAFIVGPEAAAILGDLGAEVIKVEQRGVGDPQRGVKTLLGLPLQISGGRNCAVEVFNRNKRAVALDLTKSEGREILYRLVQKSDVFITNYRNKIISKLGMDYETLHHKNPRLIYAYSSALGERGPEADSPALDAVGAARTGLMLASGEQGSLPVFPPIGVIDISNGLMLAFAVVSALLHRERGGIGQRVTSSMVNTMIKLQSWGVAVTLFQKVEVPRWRREANWQPLYNCYRCRDDRWLFLGLIREKEWPPLCAATKLQDLENDPRFCNPTKRGENRRELIGILDNVFSTKTYAEWHDILRKADLIHSPVNKYSDLENDPQIVENDCIIDYDHPVLGKTKFVGFPFALSETPLSIRYCAPEVGEHTEEILLEAGYTWPEIEKLRDKEVI